MKNLITLIIISSIIEVYIVAYAQVTECGTILPPGVTLEQAQSGDLNLYKRTVFTPPLRLAIHIVRYSNGSGGILQGDLDQKIEDLNSYMAQALFEFYSFTTDYINSDQYANIENMTEANNLRSINSLDCCINIYFVPQSFAFGISSFSDRIQPLTGIQGIIIQNISPATTLPHEMGHYFDLLHTYEAYFGYENIARSGACMNCTYKGDLLCSTNADDYDSNVGSNITSNCQYNPPVIKPDGCGQINYNPLTNNMMITQQKDNCRTTFTQQQEDRMNETLILFRSDLLLNGIFLKNMTASDNSGGMLHIGSQIYNSGKCVTVVDGSYDTGTNNERFSNYQGSGITFKHNNWNSTSSDYFLTRNLSINSDLHQLANFVDMRSGKIEARLEGETIQNKGNFHFLDPWYVKSDGTQPGSYWIPCTEFYEPTGKAGENEKGVFLNQDPTFDPNLPNYSVKVSQTQDISLTTTGNPFGRTHRFYFQNWGGSYVQFQNASALETGVVFTNTNAIAQANLKGTQLSQNSNAYNTNSQRKYVKTDDGYLHSVHESLGQVWYEVSSNNGVNWVIQNNGNPISTSGKQPAIDYHYFYDSYSGDTYHQTVIVWQEQYGSNSKIKVAYFHRVFDTPAGKMEWFDTDDVVTITGTYSTTNCTPVVSYYGSDLKVVFKNGNNGALMCRQGLVNIVTGTYLYGTGPTTLTGTNSNSVNPSIAVNKSGTTTVRLAWEQIQDASNSSIKYAVIVGSQISGAISTISERSGYPLNFCPSISVANNFPVVSWTVGVNSGGIISYRRAVISRGTLWGTYQIAGTDVNFVNNNSATSASEKTVIVWCEGTEGSSYQVNKWMKRTSSTYSTPALLSNSGIQSQVCGGTDYQYMSAMVFKNTSLPYYFLKSTTDFSVENPGEEEGGWINKITETDTIVTFGRCGVAGINGIEFVFNIGDILVGDSIIKFIEVTDTLYYSSLNELNEQTRTENFTLNTGSEFYFTNIYYTVQKSNPDSALTETDAVNFKAELVNASTNQVVGTFDNITYNKNNLEKYASIDYQVDCSGIAAGDYYLRLVTTVTGEAGYSLANIVNDKTTLTKKKYNRVSFSGSEIPVTYSLEQNYPNPFNPTTTIRYQLPKDGMVTLKVYDMLGAEVATLVNEEKVSGKYEINFDASKLASGVYIYRLNVNDPSTSSGQSFVNVKKMVLVK
jgi:hypothetical protein